MSEAIDYKLGVFPLVEKIGELVGAKVALYRLIRAQWYKVGPMNISDLILPQAQGNSNYGAYCVATDSAEVLHSLKGPITSFFMYAFPGCCAFCISSAATVGFNFQARGVNRLGIRLRQAIAAYSGYTGLICTDAIKPNTVRSIRSIEGSGFKQLHTCVNKRTKHTVNLYVKELE